MTHDDLQAIRRIAYAQAEATAIWRASKRAKRNDQHRQRLAHVTEPSPAAWLAAIHRDDLTDPVERELVLEEQTA